MSEPLAYRLSDVPKVFPIGKTKLAALIKTGELESFRVGRARFVTREALLAYMKHLVDQQKKKPDNGRP